MFGFLAWPAAALFDQIRRLINWRVEIYRLFNTAPAQPLLRWLGQVKAYGVYQKARSLCPAYRKFVIEAGVSRNCVFQDVLATSKENYVKKYTLEERCYGGAIPPRGSVIDESSGASGAPNNWVRGPEERSRATRSLQLSYQIMFGGKSNFLLNCFALGPWATGMNVSMSLANVGILKSIGPDQAKLEATLRQFGPPYRYLIFGYPPFIKQFVDTTTLSLRDYDLHAIIGGEGIAEPVRAHLEKYFQAVFSSYGASDLEINIGVETPLTVALRRLCADNPTLCTRLFKRPSVPMIFQYNPLDHYIEATPQGELLFTITRLGTAAPKIRYNLHDLGGVFTFDWLRAQLHSANAKLEGLGDRVSHFPLLYVWGRSDMTVPFYGAKVSPADVEAALASDVELANIVNSFQMTRIDDSDGNPHLVVHLECLAGVLLPSDPTQLRARLYESLRRVNQDFREVTKMFGPEKLLVDVSPYGQGIFADRDIRVKYQYIAKEKGT